MKTDEELRKEAEWIIAKSGLTDDDLFFDECPKEWQGECINYEYLRESLLNHPEQLKKARIALRNARANWDSIRSSGIAWEEALGLKNLSLAHKCLLNLFTYPTFFPKQPFLNWLRANQDHPPWNDESPVFEKVTQRSSLELEVMPPHEEMILRVDWSQITRKNADKVWKALTAMKPQSLREPPGKRVTALTILINLRAFRLLKHLTSAQAVLWMTGKNGLVSAKRFEAQARGAREVLNALYGV